MIKSERTPHPGSTPRSRKIWFSAAVAVLALCGFVLTGCRGGSHREIPNASHPIIIIDIDTLRADHLGCYGYHRDTSPSIDALAAQSVVFEYAFSQAPNTPPSQTSILTGLYPSTHGMIDEEDKVPDAVVTLAEALASQGFVTAGFHDGGYMSQEFNIGQGFQTYDSNGGKGLAQIGPKVLNWVDDHVDESFLLLIHTYDTHTPYAPTEPYRSLFLDGLEAPSPGFEPTPKIMEAIRLSVWTDDPQTLPENDIEYARALYDGEIRYVDDWVGQFLDHLDRIGLGERATVVLISDHGEEFQEHGSVLHEKLYTTVTRVPLMIRLPGASPHRRVTEVVETIDLMPTILDLVGAPHPAGLQGASLVPLITGTHNTDGIAFGESPFFGDRRFAASGRHQLLLTKKSGAVELYDFVADGAEQHDIAPMEPEITRRLSSEIANWEASIEAAALGSDNNEELDAEIRQQLKELGYIQD